MWRAKILRHLRSHGYPKISQHNRSTCCLGAIGRSDSSSGCGWPAWLASGFGSAAAGALVYFGASSSLSNEDYRRVAQCDAAVSAYAEDSDNYLPTYGSSSDPLILPFSVEAPRAFLVPVVRSQPRCPQDEAEFQQSMRAFLASSPRLSDDNEAEAISTVDEKTSNDDMSSSTTTASSSATASSSSSSSAASAAAKQDQQPQQALETRLSRLDKLRETQKSKQCVTTDRSYFYTNPSIDADKGDRFVLLAGPASQNLGLDIAQCLGVRLNEMQLGRYADGEIAVQIEESVRGKSIFIVQSTESSDSIMELFLLISTLRRASAKTITVICPYYGYARQDQRKNQRRESIAAADIALMLEEMGMDHVLCVDVHSESILGFFSPRMAVEHLFPAPVAAAYFHEELTKMWPPDQFPPVTVVASHEGQVQRATHFLSVLQSLAHEDIEVAILTKSAAGGDPTLTGNVKDRVCIMVDDIVNTGTTVAKSTKVLKGAGATKIFGWATHGVFTPEALELLSRQDDMEFFLTSNSLSHHEGLPRKIRSLNIAPLLAEAIARLFNKESLKRLMYLDNKPTDSEYHERYDSDL